jgi:hypothetical protein
MSTNGWGQSRKDGQHTALSSQAFQKHYTILVEVPDVPGAATFGEDREEA